LSLCLVSSISVFSERFSACACLSSSNRSLLIFSRPSARCDDSSASDLYRTTSVSSRCTCFEARRCLFLRAMISFSWPACQRWALARLERQTLQETGLTSCERRSSSTLRDLSSATLCASRVFVMACCWSNKAADFRHSAKYLCSALAFYKRRTDIS
jgi:hypothetical protein